MAALGILAPPSPRRVPGGMKHNERNSSDSSSYSINVTYLSFGTAS